MINYLEKLFRKSKDAIIKVNKIEAKIQKLQEEKDTKAAAIKNKLESLFINIL